ncbi:unnamed protein product [Trichobilharzia regenti]|nr:unnamed protein product [Trichobilharzia regenti]
MLSNYKKLFHACMNKQLPPIVILFVKGMMVDIYMLVQVSL